MRDFLDTLWTDLSFGFRQLRQNPGFLAIAVITLGLGIGANTAIFSVVYTSLLKPLPYPEPDRIVAIHNKYPKLNLNELGVSAPEFRELSSQQTVFSETAGIGFLDLSLTGIDKPLHVDGVRATHSLFHLLGAQPILGRTFTEEEDRDGAPKVAVLSEALWRGSFGAAPEVLHRTIRLNDEPYTIIGVMPASFQFPYPATQLWVPMALGPSSFTVDNRFRQWIRMYGRLAPGITMEQARARFQQISREYSERFPNIYPIKDAGWSLFITPMIQEETGSYRKWLLTLFAAVSCVVVIACANVAALILVRASVRRREFSIRGALGASRGRLIKQVLTESLLLSLAGGAIGLLLASWGIEFLRRFGPIEKIAMEPAIYGFALALSVITGVITGLLPAVSTSKLNLSEALKEQSRTGTASGNKQRLRNALVVSEIAVAMTLLIAAGLLSRSLLQILQQPLGFSPDRVLTAQVSLPPQRYLKLEQRVSFYREVLQKLAEIPGVEAAGGCDDLPFGYGGGGSAIAVPSRPYTGGLLPHAFTNSVTPGYFAAMRIPLRRGRLLLDSDQASSTQVAIIDQKFAEQYFPGRDPIGQQIGKHGQPETMATIVGVVGNVRANGLAAEHKATVYWNELQRPSVDLYFTVRSARNPEGLQAAMRKAVLAVDKDIPIYDVQPMQQRIDTTLRIRRFTVFVLGALSSVGILLAAVGLYGVLAYIVRLRNREIGVRMALGASQAHIVQMVVRQAITLAGTGLLLGLVGAAATSRFLSSLLFGVTASDATTFVSVTAILLLVTLLASYFPARRAAAIDPMSTLREE